ncbi:MAG: hypothetical protein IPG45_31220 [Deltaproteobacteria bacterium]|jgi:hypothetical protein|nr:hypothetical protein [Deltaproteobacteria bacterium]
MLTTDVTHSQVPLAISLLPTPTETYRGAPLLPEEFRPDPVPPDEILIEEAVVQHQRKVLSVGFGVTGFILGAAAAILS